MAFADIRERIAHDEEVEADRRKYPHLLFPLTEDGCIEIRLKECVEYMHLCSGAPKEYCATYFYFQAISDFASVHIPSESEEQCIEEAHKEVKAFIAALPKSGI